MDDKMKRAVDIVNLDNCGKVLKAESDMITKFAKTRRPLLNSRGQDQIAGELSMLLTSLAMVLGHLDGRIKELEKLNETKTEE